MDMDSPIIPCDGETTDGKTETSNNNGSKKESNKGGEVVSLKRQNEVAGRPNNASSSSGGGGDDKDNRKPHVVLSNCKRDDQVAEDDKKDEVEDEEIVAHAGESEDDGGSNDDADEEYECEVEFVEERKDIEDSSVHGGDENVKAFYTSKCMEMDSPIIPCDGETTDGKTETSNNNATKKESNKVGEAVSLKCQNEVAGRPNNASSSSGGGGDDEDNRKPHVVLSNCKRDDQAAENDKKDEVEDEEIVAHAGESEDDGGSNDDADEEYECEVEFVEERKDIEDSSIHGEDENVKAFYTSKCMEMDVDSPIIPCDCETTDGKMETSNNNVSKKESNKRGEAVSLKCQNEVAGRPNNASSSSGGGGDDEDNRKPHVVLSNCKRDDQAAENDKKDEVEDEEIVAHAGESEDDGGSNDDADEEYECEVEFAEERKDIEDSSVRGEDENVYACNQGMEKGQGQNDVPYTKCVHRLLFQSQ